jgi:hypothetical protein
VNIVDDPRTDAERKADTQQMCGAVGHPPFVAIRDAGRVCADFWICECGAVEWAPRA